MFAELQQQKSTFIVARHQVAVQASRKQRHRLRSARQRSVGIK